MVKPYRTLNERLRTFCRKASLPFPGKWTCGCGITFDIFTHDSHGSFKIYYNSFVHKNTSGDLGEGYNVAHV